MLERSQVAARLREMREQANPTLRWDQQCEGSARALVVFVGPSPGRSPHDPKQRQPLIRNRNPALWNEGYTDPLTWAGGFRSGFKPLVEAIFAAPYARASKLIARANLDWHGDSNAANVPERFMVEGAPSVLKLIADCSPELLLPMERRAYDVLRDVTQAAPGFTVTECDVRRFEVRISNGTPGRWHYTPSLRCFRATTPAGHRLVVMKLPQHPVWILEPDYGARCGAAVRQAAQQIAAGQPIDVSVGGAIGQDLIERFRGNLNELEDALVVKEGIAAALLRQDDADGQQAALARAGRWLESLEEMAMVADEAERAAIERLTLPLQDHITKSGRRP